MKRIDEMTFEEWQAHWYRVHVQLFGKGEADKWLKDNLARDTVFKEMWIQYGIKTYGQYRQWETTHLKERNEFYERRGVKW